MIKYGIIADDLTGASDTALELRKRGFKTVVITYPVNMTLPVDSYDVISVSTDSREDDKDTVKKKIRDICGLFKGLGIPYIYKKMDSTWRGNVGLEIEEILKNLNFSFAFVSSSFPELNRITVGGYLFVDGKPVNITPAGRDPLYPVKESYLPKLISGQTELYVSQVDLVDVEQDINFLKTRITEKVKTKPQIFLLDSVVNRNLENIIGAGFLISEKILFCGSAGLARAWINEIEKDKRMNKLPVMFIIGSTNPINLEQLTKLQEKNHVKLIDINSREITGKQADDYKKLICEEIISLIKHNNNVIIRTMNEFQRNRLINPLHIKQLGAALGDITNSIFKEVEIGGLVITGGATAISVLQKMGARGIEICGEIETGVPWGKIYGGKYHGLPVITKAGGFGSGDVFVKSLRRLNDIINTRQDKGGKSWK